MRLQARLLDNPGAGASRLRPQQLNEVERGLEEDRGKFRTLYADVDAGAPSQNIKTNRS